MTTTAINPPNLRTDIPVSRYTMELNGYACKWSPFHPELLAVASNKHFGFIGAGNLTLYHVSPNASTTTESTTPPHNITPLTSLAHPDNIYDLAWCLSSSPTTTPSHEQPQLTGNLITFTTSTGELIVYDILNNNIITKYQDAGQELVSVDWNVKTQQHCITASWDGTLYAYQPYANNTRATAQFKDIKTRAISSEIPANCALFHHTYQDMVIGGYNDGFCRIFDLNSKGDKSIINIKNSTNTVTRGTPNPLAPGKNDGSIVEVNTIAVDHLNPYLMYIGYNNNTIAIYDLRNVAVPLAVNNDHQFGIKKLIAHPTKPLLFSSSYDMNINIFLTQHLHHSTPSSQTSLPRVGQYQNHEEFVFGIDINPFNQQALIATASFDNNLDVWDYNNCINAYHPQ